MEEKQEERLWCIYKHTNKINGKIYIGQAKGDPRKRWHSGYGYVECPHLWNAIQKYGWHSFEHEILYDNLTLAEANKLEYEIIEELNARNPDIGYNIKEGGKNGEHSEETCRKMSLSHRGEKNHFYGKHHTEETKQKISKTKTGVPRSEAHSIKVEKYFAEHGNPMQGRHHTEEAKEKIRQARTGTHVTEETKAKISRSTKGKNNPRCRAVRCVETGIEYWGAKDAQDQLGIARTSIIMCCRGQIKTAGGFHWEYAN